MKRKDVHLLEKLLDQYFKEYDINKKGMTWNNRIAILLKRELTKKKRWKNLDRGTNRGVF
jgi:hypothetical protein